QGGQVFPQVDSTSLLPLDTWSHVVGTYDAATGELKVYFNGVLEQTVTATGPMDSQPTTPFQIGGFQHPPFIGGFFTGRIDEVHLYSRALTATEVQARTCVGPPGPPAPAVQYAYDALSRRTTMTLPNGTQTSYTYDPASQVTNILHKLISGGTQINQADYVYNQVGNRTSLTDRRGVQNFGYDQLDRLTSATHPLTLDQTYAYDPVGNRTTNASQHNAGNQLTEDAGFTYTYDANGNLTRKTVKASGVHTDYTYDAENRLVRVEEFAAGATTPAATSSYRYDGLGRRIEKVGNGLTRRYIYDGEDILLEYDETNTLLARYTHGPGIDEPIAMTRGGRTVFYHQDGLGTVTELTDGTGTVAQSYAYDAWGNPIETTGTVEQPYTYTGREFDAETGLYFYRARAYDPTIGRFLQKDPLGIGGGDLNLYSYVGSSP
ncbi:MAG: LamG-like jellyroll fold domain-containing protein, partial [Nitrospiraceae bacterium]